MKWDRVVATMAALTAPVLLLMVDQGVFGVVAATDLGGIIAAFVGAYHLNNDTARKAMDVVTEVPPVPVKTLV